MCGSSFNLSICVRMWLPDRMRNLGEKQEGFLYFQEWVSLVANTYCHVLLYFDEKHG